MHEIIVPLAQAAKPQGGADQILPLVIPFIIIMGAMLYMSYRTQKKEQRKREDMIGSVKIGDEVLTIGGMYGMVSNIKDDHFMVKIADNVKIKVAKTAVASVINEKAKEEKK